MRKSRLADEDDAAQDWGEVAGHGGERGNQYVANVPDGNVGFISDLGLTRKAIHEARQLRDAEAADLGAILGGREIRYGREIHDPYECGSHEERSDVE